MTNKSTIDVLSIFPDLIRSVLDSAILRRAQAQGILDLESTDLRAYSTDNYRSVDNTPFGGKQGMLFTFPVLDAACTAQLEKVGGDREKLKVIYPSPRGLRLEQPVLQTLSDWLGKTPGARVAVVCARYEGVDERFVDKWVDMELSLGDFILTGGELAALSLVDGVVRLIPGVLGDERSAPDESFSNGLLEYPQYTKPREHLGIGVPAELLSGHHKNIEEWKLRQSLLLTAAFRPDLIRAHNGHDLPKWGQDLLEKLKSRLDLKP